MHDKDVINVGIGFATGRRSFQKVLKTNIYNWQESGLTNDQNIRLNLLVAYDLKYSNTKSSDYTNVNLNLLDLIDDTYFIGNTMIQQEVDKLIEKGVLLAEEAKLFFTRGYAAKRNAILYTAIKNKMDYLFFLDDDEYPLAVTHTHSTALWSGQDVLNAHLKHIPQADITNGHHCGYVSPIPHILFDDTLTENDFRRFIEAISNDIINWETISAVMENGGVTYGNTKVLERNEAQEVLEKNHAKFISGSNLCINLTSPERVLPFYNPPGARGEDTFLGTCLGAHRVMKVPCYTFHDGFSTYRHLMDGVLPIKLKKISANMESVNTRFYQACIGWIRYKPLLLYLTKPKEYKVLMEEIRHNLLDTLPKVCAYFKDNNFMNLYKELECYGRNVEKHYQQFLNIQSIWTKIRTFLTNEAP